MKERTSLLMPKRRMPGCRGAADTAREERVHSVCLQRMTSFLVYTNEIVVSGIGIGYSQAGYSNCYATFWTDERDRWTDADASAARKTPHMFVPLLPRDPSLVAERPRPTIPQKACTTSSRVAHHNTRGTILRKINLTRCVLNRYVLVVNFMVRRRRNRWQWRLRSSCKCSRVRSRQRLSGSRVKTQQSSSLGSDEKGT